MPGNPRRDFFDSHCIIHVVHIFAFWHKSVASCKSPPTDTEISSELGVCRPIVLRSIVLQWLYTASRSSSQN